MLAIPGVGSVIVGGAAATLAAGVGTGTAVLGGLIGAYSLSSRYRSPNRFLCLSQDWGSIAGLRLQLRERVNMVAETTKLV